MSNAKLPFGYMAWHPLAFCHILYFKEEDKDQVRARYESSKIEIKELINTFVTTQVDRLKAEDC